MHRLPTRKDTACRHRKTCLHRKTRLSSRMGGF
nr:MAG TPA: hypothetical protein [Caudoviricetes sp.]